MLFTFLPATEKSDLRARSKIEGVSRHGLQPHANGIGKPNSQTMPPAAPTGRRRPIWPNASAPNYRSLKQNFTE